MKSACVTQKAAGNIAERAWFLIWVGLWIVALMALFPR
jgi:hypothetical protein